MADHTPGPWGLEGTTEFGYAIRGTAPGRPIADNVTTLADAKLIKAAPGLLEALKALMSCADWDGGDIATLNITLFQVALAQARAAIHEATS